ncbi:transposase [Nocardioides sp. CF8]|nr:transposase [Nocardioides sp. CF8]
MKVPVSACASLVQRSIAEPGLSEVSGLFAGIDTHKDTLAVAVVDEQGRQVASREVGNTDDGFADLAALFQRLGVVRVGIEGSGSFGRAVAVHLALLPHASWSVVEVPTLMTSRERRAQVGQGKTDPVDALAIARITARDAAGESKLAPVRLVVGPAADLRALLDYRGDLLLERTALANRAHAELTGLSPGYQHQVRSLTTRARVRQVLQLIADDHSVRADLTRRRLERIMVIDAEAAKLKRQIAALVVDAGSTLTDIHGVGPLVAARFLAEIVDARRYPTTNTFAAANGTAPIPASSGRTVRHRYNPGGNRQLNRALYTIALTQIASDTEGRAYYRRKRAEGKTGREALRCLKRRISDRVYRTMLRDTESAGQPVGASVGEPSGERLATMLAVGASDAHEVRLTA